MIYKSYYESVIGILCIEECGDAVVGLHLVKEYNRQEDRETELSRETKRQLTEYFAGERTNFQLPLNPVGTEFQKRVWNALRQIPYGETRSYGELAAMAGNPKAARAVGGANNKNPILIIIPCHRVIGADGSLVGFGAGLDVKKYLLDLEK